MNPSKEHVAKADAVRRGLAIKRTGLIPRYPADKVCPPLTSFYASWDDVDGSRRRERHSGVDGGRLGDEILSPGPGTIVAAWRANWGEGEEGAILIRHTREDLGLRDGPHFYYSEFDHVRYQDISRFTEGTRIERGETIARVSRPGGSSRYLPEVHWEVWQAEQDNAIRWSKNEFGGRFWTIRSAQLIDPLYMLSLDTPPSDDGSVDIPVFDPYANYDSFRGFTYIFPCRPKNAK